MSIVRLSLRRAEKQFLNTHALAVAVMDGGPPPPRRDVDSSRTTHDDGRALFGVLDSFERIMAGVNEALRHPTKERTTSSSPFGSMRRVSRMLNDKDESPKGGSPAPAILGWRCPHMAANVPRARRPHRLAPSQGQLVKRSGGQCHRCQTPAAGRL